MKLSTFSTFKKEYFPRKYGKHRLGRTTHKVHSFSAQTSQEGIKYDFEVKSNQDLIVLI